MKLNDYTYNNYETENKYLKNKNISRTGPKLHPMPIVQAAAAISNYSQALYRTKKSTSRSNAPNPNPSESYSDLSLR